MVREQFHRRDIWQRGQKRAGVLDVLFVVVDAGDDRDAKQNSMPRFRELAQIGQDYIVRNACPTAVTGVFHQFQIVEEKVHERADLVEDRPGGETAGIHGGLQAAGATGRQEAQQEAGLGERFTAGESHSAAGLFIENSIAFDFGNDLLDCHLPPDHLQRFGITDRRTLTADLAARPVNLD